eukprot:9503214-Pyramimonas_sp.AAC.1
MEDPGDLGMGGVPPTWTWAMRIWRSAGLAGSDFPSEPTDFIQQTLAFLSSLAVFSPPSWEIIWQLGFCV